MEGVGIQPIESKSSCTLHLLRTNLAVVGGLKLDPSAFKRFLSGWLTIAIASTSCATLNDLVNKYLQLDVAS